MNGDGFWAGEPVVVTTAGGSATALTSLFTRSGTIAVAALDGAIMSDEDVVFHAFMAAFDFPDHFGWNWDALSDCLRDLHWRPADAYIVLIDNADELLAEERDRRGTLFRILRRAATQWADPMASRRGRAVPFKVVRATTADQADALRTEVRTA